MFLRLFVRDSIIAALVVFGWWAGSAVSAGSGPAADLLGVVLGVGAGVVAYLGHEWGHLLGALAMRSTVSAPSSLASRYLFSFDSRRNGKAQFLVMSFSGFAVTGVAIWVAYGWMPDELLCTRVARGSVMFLTSLTVFIEMPLVVWSLVARSLPPVEVFPGEPTAS
jgi:hypothetical protein